MIQNGVRNDRLRIHQSDFSPFGKCELRFAHGNKLPMGSNQNLPRRMGNIACPGPACPRTNCRNGHETTRGTAPPNSQDSATKMKFNSNERRRNQLFCRGWQPKTMPVQIGCHFVFASHFPSTLVQASMSLASIFHKQQTT